MQPGLRTTAPDEQLELCLGKELCGVHKVPGIFSALLRGLVGVEGGRSLGTKKGTIPKHTREAARSRLHCGDLGLNCVIG